MVASAYRRSGELPGRLPGVFFFGVLAQWAMPFGYDNILVAQSLFYLCLLFGLLAVWGLLLSRCFSPGWFVGAVCCVLADFTLTNGFTRTSGDPVYDQSGGGAAALGATLKNCILAGNGGYGIAAHGTGTSSLAFFASRSQIWRKLLRATRTSELASGDKPVSVSEIPTYTGRSWTGGQSSSPMSRSSCRNWSRRGSFMLSTATVARPVGVRPIISAPT
jgi:hypothetical protein